MFDDMPERIMNAVSATVLAYGFIGLLSGRMERWMACGFLAVGGFLGGLNATASGEFQWAALSAGVTAMNGFVWWQGGGERQVVRLRDRLDRKDGS